MRGKERLSASVDADLLEVARTAVDEGRAESLSSWVNDALRLKADHERRMRALDDFLAGYETEHGVITDAEIEDVVRRARSQATVIRSASPGRTVAGRGR